MIHYVWLAPRDARFVRNCTPACRVAGAVITGNQGNPAAGTRQAPSIAVANTIKPASPDHQVD